jgi:adenylate cyclase
LLLAVTLGSAAGIWHLYALSEHLVQSAAIESADQQYQMLEIVNDLYTADVVNRLGKRAEASHNYATRPGAIPLPATLTIELGKLSARNADGTQVRLYSDYPSQERLKSGEGGPKDRFERFALRKLREDPEHAVISFEDYQGKPSLRYARARLMKVQCLDCHNNRGYFSKSDWKEGDVRGVVEIIRPLEEDVKRARAGLRGTFLIMGVIAGSLVGLSLLFVVVGNRRRSSSAEQPPSSASS